ncbi:MAG: 50S ribosomal protein L22 [Planctomycetota bacterium]
MENALIRLNGGYVARHRYARLTARKARLIADMIRGRGANDALELLTLSPKRAASFYLKVVESAVANAAQDEDVDVNALVIVEAKADDGPLVNNRLRYRPGPQGRALPWRKKTSHLTVIVADPSNLNGAKGEAADA